MLFGLISHKKFELEKSLIFEVLNSNIQYTNPSFSTEFNRKFFALYRIKMFRPILNVALTKVRQGEMRFKLQPMSSWDRLAGHCQIVSSAQQSIESIFIKKNYTIVIKSIKCPIIIHEIAHAIEYILDLDLHKDFRKVLASDTNHKTAPNMQVNSAVKQILRDDLKEYELKDVMSELFARFFELIAMSYEIDGWANYQYKYDDIAKFFPNTMHWFDAAVVPLLNKQIDKEILKDSEAYVRDLQKYKTIWRDKVHSTKVNRGLETDAFLDRKEVEETVQSFENWSKNKTVHTLDDGTEYYLFNDKNNFLLENKHKN